jgi:hypothetical protein
MSVVPVSVLDKKLHGVIDTHHRARALPTFPPIHSSLGNTEILSQMALSPTQALPRRHQYFRRICFGELQFLAPWYE